MIVLSMKRCFARFTSSAWRCSHNCFQRPRASQRLKRLYTASQWPKSCGKSRHGMPVRAIYNTASINMRSLCSGGLPALCLISAKMVAISAHAASVSTSLTLVISFPHDPITHHRGKDTYSRGNSSTRPSRIEPNSPVTLLLANSGDAAAVFHVYDRLNLAAIPRRYTVEPGMQLTDTWKPTTTGVYDLWVLGPNGFHRHFTGNAMHVAAAAQPNPDIQVSYDTRHAELGITFSNAGGVPGVFILVANKYYE